MSTPDLRDTFDNELRRVLIQNHPSFRDWCSTLTPHVRQVVDMILEEDVTPELIQFSQQIMEDEKESACQFMHVIAGGSPSPNVILALTNFALGDILLEVREFQKPED